MVHNVNGYNVQKEKNHQWNRETQKNPLINDT